MYKNFNITESEREEILNGHKKYGYRQPMNEQQSMDEYRKKQTGGGMELQSVGLYTKHWDLDIYLTHIGESVNVRVIAEGHNVVSMEIPDETEDLTPIDNETKQKIESYIKSMVDSHELNFPPYLLKSGDKTYEDHIS